MNTNQNMTLCPWKQPSRLFKRMPNKEATSQLICIARGFLTSSSHCVSSSLHHSKATTWMIRLPVWSDYLYDPTIPVWSDYLYDPTTCLWGSTVIFQLVIYNTHSLYPLITPSCYRLIVTVMRLYGGSVTRGYSYHKSLAVFLFVRSRYQICGYTLTLDSPFSTLEIPWGLLLLRFS